MKLDRRGLLGGLGLGLMAGAAVAQDRMSPVPTPGGFAQRISVLAAKHRLPLTFASGRFSGSGWAHVTSQARAADAVLLGEDHGVADIPALAGQLFEALRPAGYRHVGIEISPPLAREADRVLREGGLDGLKAWFARSRGVAFYILAEEAAFLARVRAATSGNEPVLFGLDYEVAGDAFILERLSVSAPASARAPLDELNQASRSSWAEFDRARDPRRVFTFSGDPELVRNVRRRWPNPSATARELLDTLEQTLAINKLQTAGDHFAARQLRADFNRANFVRWRAANTLKGQAPKALLKFGANHMMRGRNTTGSFDVGSLAAEAAALDGGRSFHLLVVPVSGQQAVFDPSAWRYKAVPAEMVLAPLVGPVSGHTVLDLRPLRPIATERSADAHLASFIHGFDAAVFLADARASANLS